MAKIFPSTTQVDKSHLAVGMSVLVSQVPSAARLTEDRPNAKTNTSEIVFFIALSFHKLLIFSPR
jgi:hypothetical protein